MGYITGLYHCSICQAPVTFSSMHTHLLICKSCGTVNYRQGREELVNKPTAVVLVQNDLIRPGATGVWRGKHFEVLGRMRFWFAESVVNFWTVKMEGGAIHYLAESYGQYAILAVHEPAIAAGLKKFTKAGIKTNLIGGLKATLECIDRTVRFEIEGEVWDAFGLSTPVFYDFAQEDGSYITIASAATGMVAFDVFDCTFQSLALANLSDKPVEPKLVKCPDCHTAIPVKTFPYAQSCSCNCGVRMVLKNTLDFERKGKDNRNDNQLLLALGREGVIKGISYEVIGYAVKQDDHESEWREYVLYSREEGYAFLNEYEGHWIYSREAARGPILAGYPDKKEFDYKGQRFDLYNKYGFRLVETAGEFPGRAFSTARIKAWEYIAPPLMWVAEQDSVERVDCFFAEYISRDEIRSAFSVDVPSPNGQGTLAPPFGKPKQITAIAIAAAALLLVLHLVVTSMSASRVILYKEYRLPDTATVNPPLFVSEQFVLNKRRNNLEFTVQAPVVNNWLELDIEAVNVKTGEEYGVSQGVEYYSGYEDGESWSEGSNTSTEVLSELPEGTYFLRLQASQASLGVQIQHFSLGVKTDVPVHSNFFILLLILLLWPAVTFVRLWVADRRRWYNSDYSPYTYEE